MNKTVKRRTFLKTLSLSSMTLLPLNNLMAGFIDEADRKRTGIGDVTKFVDYACRIHDFRNLLYLEFYFVNVEVQGKYLVQKKLNTGVLNTTLKTGSFMIVRLPQQHIAEQFFDSVELLGKGGAEVYAKTVISGYSFLAFEILFDNIPAKQFDLSVTNLMNWNNEKDLNLVIRNDHHESIFSIVDHNKKPVNEYPLSHTYLPNGDAIFDRNAYPKFNPRRYNKDGLPAGTEDYLVSDPDPITALEIPYRLILCPRLPDQDDFKFYWTFSYPPQATGSSTFTEIWMATLKIRRRKKILSNTTDPKDELNPPNVNEGDNQMEVMMIGSPDDSKDPDRSKKFIRDKCEFNKLPCTRDRHDLVYLFLGGGIAARSAGFSFTPLGVSTTINFRNTHFEKNKISLYQWDQTISFGRDQKVTVSRIVVEATYGLKMLHIQTTNRETYNKQSVLVYREYIMPLDPYKDYSLFDNNANINEYKDANWKFNSPVKKVGFRDLRPVEIRPVLRLPDELKVKAPIPEGGPVITGCDCTNREGNEIVVAFWPLTLDGKYVSWPMFFDDWHSDKPVDEVEELVPGETKAPKSIEFSKNIFILTSELSEFPDLEFVYKNGGKTQSFSELYADIFKPIEVSSLTSTFETFKTSLNTSISRLDGSQTWIDILRKSEDFALETTEHYRNYLDLNLKEIERKLKLKGEGIADQVTEEWNSFKRKVLNAEKNITSILDRILLTLEKDILQFPNAVLNKLKSDLHAVRNEIDNDIKRNYSSALSKILDYKKKLLDILDVVMKPVAPGQLGQLENIFTTAVNGYAARISPYRKYMELLGKLDQFVESLGFDHAYQQLVSRLPHKYVAFITGEIGKNIDNLKKCISELEHVEENLRSKVDLYKDRVGFAVSHVEDELQELKNKLIRDLGEDKWQETYERLRKLYHKEVNESISKLQTEYIVFKNNFRHIQTEFRVEGERKVQQVFNFFHENACFPQLHTAKVYVESINDIVHRDIPVKIKYAEDYFKNQVNNKVLEVTNNAARVFAEIKSDAKELIKGSIKEISNEIGGFVNPEIAADFLTYAKQAQEKLEETKEVWNRAKDMVSAVGKDAREEIEKEVRENIREFDGELQAYKDELKRAKNSLVLITKEAKNAIEERKNEAKAYFENLEMKILGALNLKDIIGDAMIPKLERKGDSIIYSFVTDKLVPVNAGNIFAFVPQLQKTRAKADLIVYVKKSITKPKEYSAWTALNNFTIGIFSNRIILGFEKLEIYSDQNVKNKISVRLTDVDFTKELAFIKALSNSIKIPGSGLAVNIHPTKVSVDFTYALPAISGGAFNFFNAKFIVGVEIPLPIGRNRATFPITAKFGINTPDDKFVLGVGIWGGRGHCIVKATPKYISEVDIGMDYGGLLALSLGIAQGQAYLMAGVRYVYRRNDFGEVEMELYAIITCGGSVTVFGFITISVVFILSLKYEKKPATSSLYGTASVTYSVEIGFFKKSFTLTFSKRLHGSDSNSNGQGNGRLNYENGDKESLIYAHWTEDNSFDADESFRFAKNEAPVGPQDEYDKGGLLLKDRYKQTEWLMMCKIFKF